LSKWGVDERRSVVEKTGVGVQNICADYFMEAPLHSKDSNVRERSFRVLENLIQTANKLSISDIVIPCVDQSSLDSEDAVLRFVREIRKVIPKIEKESINLSLETDLPPEPFVELLDELNSNNISVNYDIGNSAALGFDPDEELTAYGDRITDIHIKDRVLGGGPVVLGEGSANFGKFFKKIKEYNYQGPFIMQAYRDDEGVEIFKSQLNWVKQYLND